jgi:hypothetical protein
MSSKFASDSMGSRRSAGSLHVDAGELFRTGRPERRGKTTLMETLPTLAIDGGTARRRPDVTTQGREIGASLATARPARCLQI